MAAPGAAWAPELAPVVSAIGPALGLAIDDFVVRRVARLEEATLSASGLSLSDLLERIAASDALLAVLGRVVDESRRAVSEEKIAVLGRCFGKMSGDRALIDAELVWIEVFEQIDRPHLKVISLLLEHGVHGGSEVALSMGTLGELSGLRAEIQPLLGTLERLGVLRSNENSEHEGYMRVGISSNEVMYGVGPLFDALLRRLSEARV